MEEIMNDKWISIDEAAEYLGIKTVTLRSWIRNCLLYTSDAADE